jgi:hypothetical protein
VHPPFVARGLEVVCVSALRDSQSARDPSSWSICGQYRAVRDEQNPFATYGNGISRDSSCAPPFSSSHRTCNIGVLAPAARPNTSSITSRDSTRDSVRFHLSGSVPNGPPVRSGPAPRPRRRCRGQRLPTPAVTREVGVGAKAGYVNPSIPFAPNSSPGVRLDLVLPRCNLRSSAR